MLIKQKKYENYMKRFGQSAHKFRSGSDDI